MARDLDRTQTLLPGPTDDPALDAALAAAFGPDSTPHGWSRPPLLRDDPSDHGPLVQPSSPEALRASSERYQFLGEIARGGMGVILKGRDPDLGRDLAVKVLKIELAGKPSAEQRFVEEAQVCGQLQHPGVVPVHDLGRLPDGRPFFAMKLVKGRTLAADLADRPDPTYDRGRFLQVFAQVCQTMAYAHARGVIHRDLKPANIMVGNFGEVQVMDWGLAKVLPQGGIADEQRATQASRERERPEQFEPTVIHTARSGCGSETLAGSVMGTPAFMPPEQAGGEIDKLDERADVFGLGAILCVILTGKPPYVAADSEAVRLMAVRGRLSEAFARLDGCGADPELVALAKRCLAAEPANRPRHAGEVKDALQAYLAAVEDRAHRAEVERAKSEAKTAEERKRRRAHLALAASVGLLLLGGGTVAWWQDRQAADRGAQLARNTDALADLVGRCEAALREDDAERAAAALSEIERRLAEGGGEAFAQRVDHCRADLRMLRELDAIDAFWFLVVESKLPDRKDVAVRWRAAFAAYGMPIGEAAADTANRVSGSQIRDRLLAALDLSLVFDPSPGVRAVLRAADPDPYRDTVRDAVAANDAGRVVELAGQPAALAQPPGFAAALGRHEAVPPSRCLGVLKAALQSKPDNFNLLMNLADRISTQTKASASQRALLLRAALAAQPRNVVALNNLGHALMIVGDLDEAVAYLREAIRLDSTIPHAHGNLGLALEKQGDLDGALAAHREAIRVDPKHWVAHVWIAEILMMKKSDWKGAIASFREAIRLNPECGVDYRLGFALRDSGDPDGAIAVFRDHIRRHPKVALARTYYGLGLALWDKKDLSGAISGFREAVRLDPNDYDPQFRLGFALQRSGRPAEALQVTTDALKASPTWADDPRNYLRYNAGCFAMNCADGKGTDAPPPAERPVYRMQALDHLTADLAAIRKLLAADPARNRDFVHKRMLHWLRDADLASVRDRAGLEKLPPEDQVLWATLWAEVQELRDATAPPEKGPPPREVNP